MSIFTKGVFLRKLKTYSFNDNFNAIFHYFCSVHKELIRYLYMKTLKAVIDKVDGFRFVIDLLDLKSGLGKRLLLAQSFMVSEIQLENQFANLTMAVDLVKDDQRYRHLQTLEIKLNHVKDIQNTLKRLSSSALLDDIELFEIKSFAIVCQEISTLNNSLKLSFLQLPDLQKVVDFLDPDRQNIPHFYIYSSYSEELLQLREEEKQMKLEDPTAAEILRLKVIELEDVIREKLSSQLFPFVSDLQRALETLGYLDVMIAKAQLAVKYGFARPIIQHKKTTFVGLFNPQVKSVLNLQQKEFQPIDIEIFANPCLITGVNMGGKTVLLKTIGLAQYLFQFGFFVPAVSASMAIVEQILMSIGDDQSELSGLSSFAAEMLNVDAIIRKSKVSKKILVLIDELARTTNPEEGKAIVNATLDILSEHHIPSLITTHYSGLVWEGRRLRVKGLQTEKLTHQLTAKNINDFMDYSLVENDSETINQQALRIARLLGVDLELLDKAAGYLKN